MKIALFDTTAQKRLELQSYLDSIIRQTHELGGICHQWWTHPCSRQELLLQHSYQVAILGPGLTLDDAFNFARNLKSTHRSLEVIVISEQAQLSLRTLRRFDTIGVALHTQDEPPSRLVHSISLAATSNHQPAKLIWLQGAKGGIGTTSIATGIAQAAVENGLRALLVDLSQCSTLASFLGLDDERSGEYAACLLDNLHVDEGLCKQCVIESSCGFDLLLQPAGGMDVRELWLRDELCFGKTIAMLEILGDSYDLVVIDSARQEGILPFALFARADIQVFVTSNSADSVFLTRKIIDSLPSPSASAERLLLINSLHHHSLTSNDILDSLCTSSNFEESFARLPSLTLDAPGQTWIGSRNSFYLHGSKALQHTLSCILKSMLSIEYDQDDHTTHFPPLLTRLLSFWPSKASLEGKATARIEHQPLTKSTGCHSPHTPTLSTKLELGPDTMDIDHLNIEDLYGEPSVTTTGDETLTLIESIQRRTHEVESY